MWRGEQLRWGSLEAEGSGGDSQTFPGRGEGLVPGAWLCGVVSRGFHQLRSRLPDLGKKNALRVEMSYFEPC